MSVDCLVQIDKAPDFYGNLHKNSESFTPKPMKGVQNTKMEVKTTKPKVRNKIRKESPGERVFDIFNIIFLLAISICMIYPLWHVICASFSNPSRVARTMGTILYPMNAEGGLGFSWAAYAQMWTHPLIKPAYINSIFIVVVGTTINIIMTSICAYVLSRQSVMLKKPFTLFVMFTMFFSGGMIPSYIVNTQILGLSDSYLSLLLPGAISVYNMIIMRTNFESIPPSLDEAARLDGAGHMRILFQVVLPLSKAIIAVMILYYAVGHWNSWFQASLYIRSAEKKPLQLILREILIQNDTSSMSSATSGTAAGQADQAEIGETLKYATIIFATVPILCVYPFLQKHFTKGVMVGAVKG